MANNKRLFKALCFAHWHVELPITAQLANLMLENLSDNQVSFTISQLYQNENGGNRMKIEQKCLCNVSAALQCIVSLLKSTNTSNFLKIH